MKNAFKLIDLFLNLLKRVLIKLKNNKFGLSFLINIFVLPKFFNDSNVSIIKKFKVSLYLILPIIYLMSFIDILPEFLLGIFGYIDDLMVIIFSLDKVNEELIKYKKDIKGDINTVSYTHLRAHET